MTTFTRKHMIEYLRSPELFDCTLRISYSTIALKSYGAEKRFLVPAPIISLEGKGWDYKFKQVMRFCEQQARQSNVDLGCLPDPTIEGAIAIRGVDHHPILDFEFDNNVRKFFARTLYIRHAEKRNFFQMILELKYNNGCRLGIFTIDRVKVISKASKAKNLASDIESRYLAVCSGQKVCLYSRPKAPPVANFITRENDMFSSSTINWTPLTIYLVDRTRPYESELDFNFDNGPICFGDLVRLVDEDTGLSFPSMRICKVNKDNVVFPVQNTDDREVVNQVQKVVFQLVDTKDFTCLQVDDKGVTTRTMEPEEKAKEMPAHDSTMFTIVCTTKLEYTFYEAMNQTMLDVFPAPTCLGISLDSVDMFSSTMTDDSTASIFGQNFTDNLSVWFGAYECNTGFCGTELLEFIVPPPELVADKETSSLFVIAPNTLEVPISLVREDGVIFATGLRFTYTNAAL